ncbi:MULTISPECIES: hypothetical protein [Methanobacterium]|uniref:Uncharacterized protein n=1 Tax=Methanobacterium bryantii TaxID=2161 RepID=A0A2A2H7N5_METBR|nr:MULTISPECIES: hypothetical protein [Methanobacterium]OEC85363.1 hypothetical protein A9507_13635 [Methanobacterium sp. A39]PAV05398.1 hypothetical protein ASJ80_09725 [Methanobacterium bryantii]
MAEHETKNTSEDLSSRTVDEDIFNEVNKFLKEKEQYIKDSIIGSRVMEELGEFTLDVGIKKTYLCAKESENVYSVLTKVIEKFIQAYGGTATIYPKGEQICLELITPKRGV